MTRLQVDKVSFCSLMLLPVLWQDHICYLCASAGCGSLLCPGGGVMMGRNNCPHSPAYASLSMCILGPGLVLFIKWWNTAWLEKFWQHPGVALPFRKSWTWSDLESERSGKNSKHWERARTSRKPRGMALVCSTVHGEEAPRGWHFCVNQTEGRKQMGAKRKADPNHCRRHFHYS